MIITRTYFAASRIVSRDKSIEQNMYRNRVQKGSLTWTKWTGGRVQQKVRPWTPSKRCGDLPQKQAQTEEPRTTQRRDPDVLEEAHSWGVQTIHWPLTKGDACCYLGHWTRFAYTSVCCCMLVNIVIYCYLTSCADTWLGSMTPRGRAGLVLCWAVYKLTLRLTTVFTPNTLYSLHGIIGSTKRKSLLSLRTVRGRLKEVHILPRCSLRNVYLAVIPKKNT